MTPESSLRQRALGLLADISLHKLAMMARLPFSKTAEADSTAEGIYFSREIAADMARRGWTPEQVDEAVKHGEHIAIADNATGAAAIRYIHPTTHQSVAIDADGGEIIFVGKKGWRFTAGRDRPSPLRKPSDIPAPPPIPDSDPPLSPG